MDVALRSIIVWSRQPNQRCRQVTFKEGAINVISGQSGSGKSSLIHIVDYCLGSGKCSIPVGVIRETVEWFAVLLQLRDLQLLVGRKNPEEKDQTGDAFIIEEKTIDPSKHVPEKNANVEYVKQRLNTLAGLPNIGFDPESASGFKGPPSFRDLAAFMFQPQHIVANPNTIFFKTDTFEHREKLRSIFPLVLGVVTGEQLLAKHTLSQLQAELELNRTNLERQREAAEKSAAQFRAFVGRGQELGLLPLGLSVGSAEQLVTLLQLVPQRLAEGLFPAVDVGAADSAVSRIRALEEQENSLARNLSAVTRRQLQMERLKSSVASYGEQLLSHTGRLAGAGWFANRVAGDDHCPFCGSESLAAHAAVSDLVTLASDMQRLSASASTATPALEREINRLSKETRKIESELSNVRQEKWYLQDESVELAERRRTETEAFRLAGRIEEAVEVFEGASAGGNVAQKIADLESRISALRPTAMPPTEAVRLSGALQRFTQAAARYAERLELGGATDPIELNINELTVNVLRPSGRRDALWEIGSAENWVGYHIATLLGLHEEFLREERCPVPSFLMVDQPSQAYFPDRWPGDISGTEGQAELDRRSGDIAGVHRIFAALALAIERTKGRLQIIVTDHAGPITWLGIPSVNFIANWREEEGEFLIPKDWQT